MNKSGRQYKNKAFNRSRLPEALMQNRTAVFGGILILMLTLVAVLAPYISLHDPLEQNRGNRLSSPSFEYPFGTDNLGRCVFSRIILGTRYSLGIGILVVAISSFIGTTLGMVSGYNRGIIDEAIMRFVDIVLAFPSIILALVIAGALGPSLSNVIIALALTHWPAYTRLVRGIAFSLREKEFVEAAKALRASDIYIMRRHIFPNCINPIIVLATLDIANAIIFATALSFLGLGIQSPTPEWGSMLKAGIPFMRTAPLLTIFPGIAIMTIVLAFNFLGDGLRDMFDPRGNELMLVNE
ncbi:nickel transporter permease [uncultured Methanolobus sp.]|uniref:nickel transporter permease n=1 Tax=uncultured Methanolobus sp. TaxID=218300 RepID=UPI002AAA736B|nr:nickel transporter permease [uncultured Methanolobus sp.]